MGAPRSLGLCHYYLGATDYFGGRFSDALAHLHEAISLFHRVDAPAGEAVSLQFLGMTESALGNLDEGRRRLEQGVVVAQRGAMRSHTLIRLYAALGRNRLDANDPAAARSYVDQGLALVEAHERCICNASIHCIATACLALTGDLARAEEMGKHALARASDLGSPFFLCMGYQANAMVYALLGRWDAAFQALDLARTQAEAIDLRYELARILLLRAFVHLRRRAVRDLPAATARMAEASQVLLSLGARASIAQARSSLGFLLEQSVRPAARVAGNA